MYVFSNANPFRQTENMALFFPTKLDSNVGAKSHEVENFLMYVHGNYVTPIRFSLKALW